jgi:Fe-S-cluster containining protein
MRVVRPVVRAFDASERGGAARHARAGGHAVVWNGPHRATLVMPAPDENDSTDLGYWALLDLDEEYWHVATTGPFRGLGTFAVRRDCLAFVRRRAERDACFRGATRAVDFDCLACGACCRQNRVELDDEDMARFDRAGRPELYRAPYATGEGGRVFLRLTRARRCRHLGPNNACAIYAFRPEACSIFPVGSECCLSVRERDGMVDGVPER